MDSYRLHSNVTINIDIWQRMATGHKVSRFFSRLRNKYRLVIVNDTTFEEKQSFVLSRLNVISFFSLMIILVATIVLLIVVYTPLKNYIIGYSEIETRNMSIKNSEQIAFLENEIRIKDRYITGIQKVLRGEIGADSIEKFIETTQNYESLDFRISEEDSILRAQVEAQEKYNLSFSEDNLEGEIAELSDLFLFPPLTGRITGTYDLGIKHMGVDIVAPEGTGIKSVLPGTVIFTGWTNEDGYVVHIQHDHNLISTYKHNSALLKGVGDIVDAGTTVAIIGNTGELSEGPHLHFELWHVGKPLNPEDYIIFN